MSDPYIGEIRIVGFNFAPSGWALCNGALLSIAQNNALFALLGTFYGGNGTTTFQLPDLQGRSPVGTGNGLGLSPITIGQQAGTEAVTLTTAQMPAHTHLAQVTGGVSVSGSVAIPACSTSGSANSSGTPAANTVLGQITVSGRAGDLYTTTAADTTLQPFNVQMNGPAPTITNAVTGGNLPVPLRNPYLGLTFIIALNGIFPSRG